MKKGTNIGTNGKWNNIVLTRFLVKFYNFWHIFTKYLHLSSVPTKVCKVRKEQKMKWFENGTEEKRNCSEMLQKKDKWIEIETNGKWNAKEIKSTIKWNKQRKRKHLGYGTRDD